MIKNSELITLDEMKDFYHEDIDKLLHKILSYARKITSCDAGTIYLKENDFLVSKILQNDSLLNTTTNKLEKKLNQLKFKIQEDTNTIAIESIIKNKIITVDDVYLCEEFNFTSSKSFDQEYSYKTKSILTAPLINCSTNEQIGVIQLINKKDTDGTLIAFTQNDKEFISMSSYFISLSIINITNIITTLSEHNNILEKEINIRTEKLTELANKDPMTKLFNRRYLQDITSHIINISNRLNNPIGIMLIDIDNFKKINDKYGHAIGDKVIISLANIFENNTRQSDISIRFGGEEFVIILPNTNKENTLKLANKIKNDVENFILKVKDETVSFTISIGITIVNKKDKTFENSLSIADKALYISKENGKNQISFLEKH